jgi:hypothetical protein
MHVYCARDRSDRLADDSDNPWLHFVSSRVTQLVSGLRTGRQIEETARRLEELDRTGRLKIQKVSDRVLYASTVQEAVPLTGSVNATVSERDLNQILTPVSNSLDSEVLFSRVAQTPEKLRKAFEKNSWEVLDNVRPADRAVRPSNPDAVPVLFADGPQQYLGWQMRGALPSFLDCEFTPASELDRVQ